MTITSTDPTVRSGCLPFFSWRFVAMRGWWASFSWSGAYRLSTPRVLFEGISLKVVWGAPLREHVNRLRLLAKFYRLMPKSESCLRKVGTLSRKIGSLDARQTEALG